MTLRTLFFPVRSTIRPLLRVIRIFGGRTEPSLTGLLGLYRSPPKAHAIVADDWDEYTVTRRFRGSEYAIHVQRGSEKGITVNGAPISGEVVPLTAEPSVQVEVTL